MDAQRRKELLNEIHEMADTRIVGEFGERVTFGELRALLKSEAILERVDQLRDRWEGQASRVDCLEELDEALGRD